MLVCLALVLGAFVPVFAGSYDREDADEAGYVNCSARNSDGSLFSGAGYIYAVTLYAASATSTLTIYDASSATGNVVIEVAEATAGDSARLEFTRPVKVSTGAYADLSGSNAAVVVEYR